MTIKEPTLFKTGRYGYMVRLTLERRMSVEFAKSISQESRDAFGIKEDYIDPGIRIIGNHPDKLEAKKALQYDLDNKYIEEVL
jgi:hypothetical protein